MKSYELVLADESGIIANTKAVFVLYLSFIERSLWFIQFECYWAYYTWNLMSLCAAESGIIGDTQIVVLICAAAHVLFNLLCSAEYSDDLVTKNLDAKGPN